MLCIYIGKKIIVNLAKLKKKLADALQLYTYMHYNFLLENLQYLWEICNFPLTCAPKKVSFSQYFLMLFIYFLTCLNDLVWVNTLQKGVFVWQIV